MFDYGVMDFLKSIILLWFTCEYDISNDYKTIVLTPEIYL